MSLRLPRLPAGEVGWGRLQLWWQRLCEAIETAFTALADTVAAVAAAQAAADAANTAADAAQAAADAAQAAADGISTADALRASYTDPVAVLTASDAGSDATITIGAHTRRYADGVSVSVSGGVITGLAYSTSYWVGYFDAARAGGSVVYVSDTVVRGNGVVADYHFVGAVTTPGAGGGPVDGLPVVPPGGVIP